MCRLGCELRKSGDKVQVLSEVSNIDVLKVRRREMFSDTCGSTKKAAREVLFQPLRYPSFLLKYSVP